MTTISALEGIHIKGLFGDFEKKDEKNLIKISEKSDLLIVQIVQYTKSPISLESIKIDNLNLKNNTHLVISNKSTRILWCGPKNWILVSSKKDLLKEIKKKLNETDFAITDLSHSKTTIELEGDNIKEVLKKGCPFDIDQLKKDNCFNSVFNGLSVTIDILEDSTNKIRIFTLRSFGESLHHSITDACLEFGYKNI